MQEWPSHHPRLLRVTGIGLAIMLSGILCSCGQRKAPTKSPYAKSPPPERSVYVPGSQVVTFAGTHRAGCTNGSLERAAFNNPVGICTDKKGVFYVADNGNHCIRKITPQGITTFAGSTVRGYADGKARKAMFNSPKGICIDASQNVYVADFGNHCIRKITPDGKVTTLAGSPKRGLVDGQGPAARFFNPSAVCIDVQGVIYVADLGNHRIRKITPNGTVTTFAGSGSSGMSGDCGGFADGQGTQSQFRFPSGLAVDPNGNLYVGDEGNHRIRKIDREGMVSTLAGSGPCGYGKGAFADGPVAEARFNVPRGVCVDDGGNILVADVYNNRIRQITSDGKVLSLAGKGEGYASGAGMQTAFSWPMDVCADHQNRVYITDFGNHCIRAITR